MTLRTPAADAGEANRPATLAPTTSPIATANTDATTCSLQPKPVFIALALISVPKDFVLTCAGAHGGASTRSLSARCAIYTPQVRRRYAARASCSPRRTGAGSSGGSAGGVRTIRRKLSRPRPPCASKETNDLSAAQTRAPASLRVRRRAAVGRGLHTEGMAVLGRQGNLDDFKVARGLQHRAVRDTRRGEGPSTTPARPRANAVP